MLPFHDFERFAESQQNHPNPPDLNMIAKSSNMLGRPKSSTSNERGYFVCR